MAVRSFAKIAKEVRSLPRAQKPLSELFRDAMRLAREVVPSDGWGVLTLEPATLLATGGVYEHAFAGDELKRYFELEYGEEDCLKFSALSRELTPVGTLSAATMNEPNKSARFRELLSPAGYAYEQRAVLRSTKHTWGALFLLRRGVSDFGPEEESFTRELGDALGDAIRATLRASNVTTDTRTSRAILLLDQKQELLAASPSAPAWLDELAVDGPRDAGGVPHTVRSTVNGARRGVERGGQTTAHVRVRGASGRWLTVHAAVLGDGQVVVTLDEGRMLPLPTPILESYALTPLEGEVLRDVLHGFDDTQIAERLGVTVPALQTDRLVLLRKVGVDTRLELTKKLFFEHFYERVRAGAPLGADGWFSLP